jgi:cell division protein FtsZ
MLEGVEFVVANTDAQALQQSRAGARIQMGVKVTEGLGRRGPADGRGRCGAEETIEEIVDHLAGAHMCFITAGMGGGTGTGAAPIIAQAARELGVLTVGVVTKPFQFEGGKRMRQAEEGIEALQKVVDTLIIIPNQNLFRLANERTTFTEAFAMADDVLYQGVKGVTDLMVRPGLINLDFADVRAVMDEMGKAMMGTGEATGEDRAVQAAEKAIANPLLDEISLNGAKGVLINITGGHDLTLFELDEAANIIREKVDPDANIIVGSTLDTVDGRPHPRVGRRDRHRRFGGEQGGTPGGPPRDGAPLTLAPAPQPEAPRAAAPVYAPTPAPVMEDRVAFEEEIDQVADAAFDAAASRADMDADDLSIADDLPPPAYRPQPAAQPTLVRSTPAAIEADPSGFVAPRPRVAGQPSPEALARLQAAVSRPGSAPAKFARPAPVAAQAPAAAPAMAGAKPRFGIGSLINRMAGHLETNQAAPAARAQPPVTAYDDDHDMGSDQDRIEIPAFLRRQAN